MVVVDYSHLMHRNLHIAISQAHPKKINGKYDTDEYMSFFFHLMLNSLRLLGHKFAGAGEVILAIDDQTYWRKDIYPDYKGKRKAKRDKSDIDYSEFYKRSNEFLYELEQYFPYTVLNVPKCEADDIIGVLSKFYGRADRVVVVSSDKDMRQCIVDGAELYDPIKKEFVRMSIDDAKRYKIQHTLLGDDGDNIPHIMHGTSFTDNFLKYLKTCGIYVDNPVEFNKLSISGKLYAEYDVYKKNRKGEVQPEKDTFKKIGFGEVGALKASKDLVNFFKEKSPIVKENYEWNSKLVLFEHIPPEITNNIIQKYNSLEVQYDPNKIMQFLMKYNLRKLLMDITDFYITPQKKQESVLDEWL